MDNVLIIGGKGMQLLPAEALLEAERLGIGTQRFSGFLLDDLTQADNLKPLGPIVGSVKDAKRFAQKGYKIHFALWHSGKIGARAALFESLGLTDDELATIISPKCDISALATIGAGTFIGAFTHVGAGAHIGRGNFINPQCNIDHNSQVGDYNVFAAEVMLHGKTVGARNFFGIKTLIDASIGSDNYIGFSQVIREPIGDCLLVTARFPKIETFPVEMIEVLNFGTRN